MSTKGGLINSNIDQKVNSWKISSLLLLCSFREHKLSSLTPSSLQLHLPLDLRDQEEAVDPPDQPSIHVAPVVTHAFASPLQAISRLGKTHPWCHILEWPVFKNPSSGLWSRTPRSGWRRISTTSLASKTIKTSWLQLNGRLRFFWPISTTRRVRRRISRTTRPWCSFLSG